MLLLLALACAPKPEVSPPSFDDLNVGALAHFHDDEGEAYALGLRDWLLEHEAEWTAEDFPGGYTLGKVGADELGSIEHDDEVDWNETLGAGVPLLVRGDIAGFAAAATEPDQIFADPKTYIRWDRTITEGSAAAFLDGEEMKTDNDIEKSLPLGLVLPYFAHKDFRWYGDVLAAITWVPERAMADEQNGLVFGCTIEIWFEHDGQTYFYNGSWTQSVTVIGDEFPEDILVDQYIQGTIDYMEGIDAFVMGEYVPDEE